jgi:hypothetical protein
MNIVFLILSKTPWGVTTPFSYWGGWILRSVGVSIENWSYFAGPHKAALTQNILTNGGSLVNLGVIFGALLASICQTEHPSGGGVGEESKSGGDGM